MKLLELAGVSRKSREELAISSREKRLVELIGPECWRHYRNRWRQVASQWNANCTMWHNTGCTVYNLEKVIKEKRNGWMTLDRSFYHQWKHAISVLARTKDGLKIVEDVFSGNAFESVFGNDYHMSKLQKLSAYLVWYGLHDSGVTNQIGEMMERNIQMPDTELGGYLRLSSFERLLGLSVLERPNLSKGRAFGYSKLELTSPENFVCAHLHAVEQDSSKWLGPSGFEDNPVESSSSDGDTAIMFASDFTEFRGVVFTKIPGRNFAAHYFCTDSTPYNEAGTQLKARIIYYADSVPLGIFGYN